MNTIGNYAPDFEIPGIDREVYHLGSYLKKYKAIAVVFISNHSSSVDRYIESLKQIQADFGDRNFQVIAIDSNHRNEPIAASMAIMEQYACDRGLNFPYLRDSNQDVAKSFKVKLIPTVYLIDSNAIIRYQGRIDGDSDSTQETGRYYLRDSISAVLSNTKVAKDYIEPVGDEIQWRPKS